MITQYGIGWQKYVSGHSLSDCENDEQRRGWNAAKDMSDKLDKLGIEKVLC